MTTFHASKVHVGLATCKGSIVRAEINEAPVCVSISTEDVSIQVAVAVPNWSKEQDELRLSLPDSRQGFGATVLPHTRSRC